jgi:hypothetical protein
MTFTVARSLRFLVPLALVCVGCVQVRSSKTELTMQVEPAQQQGAYTVTGKTNLPDRTQITVQAIRNLRMGDRVIHQNPTYSILSRTQVEVKEGKWETTLNLLQAPNGQPLEVWQASRPQTGLTLEPDTKVTFLAVTDPVTRSLNVAEQNQGAESLVVRFTADGRSYLQADQVLTISPPTSPIGQSNQKPERVKVAAKAMQGAGDLKEQSDAPIAPQAFLR